PPCSAALAESRRDRPFAPCQGRQLPASIRPPRKPIETALARVSSIRERLADLITLVLPVGQTPASDRQYARSRAVRGTPCRGWPRTHLLHYTKRPLWCQSAPPPARNQVVSSRQRPR